MTVEVSVILPTFNRAHTLNAAATSVLSQSHSDLELIIVDDGSSDNTASVVQLITDPRVRYIVRNENGGAAAARNSGIAVARGEYIAFQDSDDIWLPNKLKSQLSMFATLPATVGVVTGAKIVYGIDDNFTYGEGKIAYAPPPRNRLKLDEDQVHHLLKQNRLSVQNALFRKNCFPHSTWFDTRAKANEDWEFAIRLAQHTKIYEDVAPVVLGFASQDSISSNILKHTLGVIRVYKNNFPIVSKHPEVKSALLLDISRYLCKSNKKKLGMKFLMAAVRNDPLTGLQVLNAATRKLRSLSAQI